MDIELKQNEIISASENPKKHGIKYFIDILDSQDDPLCKWHALKAIGDLKDAKAKQQLLSILQQPDHEFDESSLHRICAWSIGQIGSVLCKDISNLLENTSSLDIKIALIDALGEIADPVSIPILAKELISESKPIRLWTALSLAKIGEDSLYAFSDALKEADDELVFIITDALAIIGSENTVPILLDAFSKKPFTVKEYFLSGSNERTSNYAQNIINSNSIKKHNTLCEILVQVISEAR